MSEGVDESDALSMVQTRSVESTTMFDVADASLLRGDSRIRIGDVTPSESKRQYWYNFANGAATHGYVVKAPMNLPTGTCIIYDWTNPGSPVKVGSCNIIAAQAGQNIVITIGTPNDLVVKLTKRTVDVGAHGDYQKIVETTYSGIAFLGSADETIKRGLKLVFAGSAFVSSMPETTFVDGIREFPANMTGVTIRTIASSD